MPLGGPHPSLQVALLPTDGKSWPPKWPHRACLLNKHSSLLFVSLAFKQTLSKVSADSGRFAENHSLLKSPGFMLQGGGCEAFRPGVSQPQERMFILWALIGKQQRLIFMEKKNNKSRKGEGGRGEGLVLVTGSKRLWQVGVWQCPPTLRWGWGPVPEWAGPPWTLYRRQVSLLLAFHPLQRLEWASSASFGRE